MTWQIVQTDAIDFLRSQPAGSVDLVFGSPPYEEARLYLEGGKNLNVARKTEAWVAWMVEVYKASLHACKGLVAFVVEGQTRKFRYSTGPALLMADLHRAGVCLRKPPVFHRVGIPGSGGPDWLRNDYEFIICATNGGKLPWSDNTACGHPPKWAPGGSMSYRELDGTRVNSEKSSLCPKGGNRRAPDGTREKMGQKPLGRGRNKDGTPKARLGRGMANGVPGSTKGSCIGRRVTRGTTVNGELLTEDAYLPPTLANPGNVLKYNVGGGVMGGDEYCSQNEAPFPEALAAFFVQSFCPPGGLCADPFSGSGTTGAVAVRNGRRFTGCDLRDSQVILGRKRIEAETPLGLFA